MRGTSYVVDTLDAKQDIGLMDWSIEYIEIFGAKPNVEEYSWVMLQVRTLGANKGYITKQNYF